MSSDSRIKDAFKPFADAESAHELKLMQVGELEERSRELARLIQKEEKVLEEFGRVVGRAAEKFMDDVRPEVKRLTELVKSFLKEANAGVLEEDRVSYVYFPWEQESVKLDWSRGFFEQVGAFNYNFGIKSRGGEIIEIQIPDHWFEWSDDEIKDRFMEDFNDSVLMHRLARNYAVKPVFVEEPAFEISFEKPAGKESSKDAELKRVFDSFFN